MRETRHRRLTHAVRPGFTLAEVLVVITIIGILAAISAGAYLQYMNVQRTRNVELLIRKLDAILESQYKSVHYQSQSTSLPGWATELSKDSSGNPNPIRARVIYRKMLLKQAFPQSFAEITNPPLIATSSGTYSPLPVVPTYASQVPVPNPLSPDEERSTCLYMIVSRAPSGNKSDTDVSMSSVEALDPHNIGVKHFRDPWGNPLIFRRWPNDLVAVNASNGPSAGTGNDLDDPEGSLCSPTWASTTNAGLVLNLLNQPGSTGIPALAQFAPSMSYSIFPVIGSMGADNAPNTNDDIYNFRLRSLNRRGDS